MNLILFVHQDASQQGQTLQKHMAEYFGKNTIQMVLTFNALKHIFKQTESSDQGIYILPPESPWRLPKLFCLIDLVFPNGAEITASIVRRFYPRFFTYITSAYDDLFAAFHKRSIKKTYN